MESVFPWIIRLPSLRERLADIEAAFDHALDAAERRSGTKTGFAPGARARYMRFATSIDADWSGSYRDLSDSLLRLCTLAERGRVTVPMIDEEITELSARWRPARQDAAGSVLTDDMAMLADIVPDPAAIDMFDRIQLATVVRICRMSSSLSDAGRALFSVSRTLRSSRNDADRLRKYLARFDLDWDAVRKGVKTLT